MNSQQSAAWPRSEWITIASAWQVVPCDMSGSKRSRYSRYSAKRYAVELTEAKAGHSDTVEISSADRDKLAAVQRPKFKGPTLNDDDHPLPGAILCVIGRPVSPAKINFGNNCVFSENPMGGVGSGTWTRPSRKATVEDSLTIGMASFLHHFHPVLNGTLFFEPLGDCTIPVDYHLNVGDGA